MRGIHIQQLKTGFARSARWRISAVVIVLVLFQVAVPVWGQTQSEPEGLTLPLAVEIALRSNPGLHAVTTGQTLAQVGTQEARAGRLPVISVSEVVTNGNNPVYVFGSLLEQSRFAEKNFALDSLNNPDPLTNFRTQIQVRYPLFDQRRTQTQIAKAEIGEQQAATQYEMVEQRLRFEVIRAYFGVLVAQANQRVANQAVETAEVEAKRVKDMFDSGMVVASDLLSIETQLAEFRQQQIQAAGDIRTAQAALNTVLGVAIDHQQSVTGTLEGQSFTVPPESELITTALASHPEYRQAALAVEQRQKDQHGARGEYQPRTDLFATLGNSGHKLVNGSGDYAVGVSVTFDLFKPGRSERVKQADLAREISEYQLQQKANELRFEVVRANQHFLSAKARLDVATKAVSQAQEVLRIVRDRYGAGITTVTEVLRAQTALVRAQTNELFARYDYVVGFAQIQLASGQLKEVGPFVR